MLNGDVHCDVTYPGASAALPAPSSSTASWAWPGDSEKVTAVRASAAMRWIFVFHPPRDLPIACGPFFFEPPFRADAP